MGFFPSIYETIIDLLIYVVILLLFLTAENNEKRFHLVIAVAGFFTIKSFFPNDFFLGQAFFVGWVTLMDIKLIVSKKTMLILLAVMFFLPLTSPFFYVISFVFYVVVVIGWIIQGFSKVTGKINAS